MDKKIIRIQFWAAIGMIVVLSVFAFVYGPVELLEMIGISNGYILAFVLALFAGVMFLTSAFFYATLAALIAAGSHPIILSLIAGVGLFLGDVLIFYIGKKGRDSLQEEHHPKIVRFTEWMSQQSYPVVSICIILYGITPIPNEFMMIFLSFAKYSFRKVWWAILLGDILIVFVISQLSEWGLNFL